MPVDSSLDGASGEQQRADLNVETTREQLAGALDATLRLCTEFADRCGLNGGSAAPAEPEDVLRTAAATATPPHHPFIVVPADASAWALSSGVFSTNEDGEVCIPSGGVFGLPSSLLPSESKACDPINYTSPTVSCLQQRALGMDTSSGCAVAVLRLQDAHLKYRNALEWADIIRFRTSELAPDPLFLLLRMYFTVWAVAMPVLLYRVREAQRAALRAMRVWRGVHAHPHVVAAVEAATGEVVLLPPAEKANICALEGHHVARALLAILGCGLVGGGLYIWQSGGGDGGPAFFRYLDEPMLSTSVVIVIVSLAFASVPVRADVPTIAAIGIRGGGGGSIVAVAEETGSCKLRVSATTGTVNGRGAYSPLAQLHTA
jgi:hypothetical protein